MMNALGCGAGKEIGKVGCKWRRDETGVWLVGFFYSSSFYDEAQYVRVVRIYVNE
jgi:hypothetical protein